MPFGRDFHKVIFELLGMCVCRGVPDHNPPSEVVARSRFGRNGPLDAACPAALAAVAVAQARSGQHHTLGDDMARGMRCWSGFWSTTVANATAGDLLPT